MSTGHLHLYGFEPVAGDSKKEAVRKDDLFFGAGDRTRTGTPSLAADFERRGFSRIRGDSEALKGTIHLAKRIKTMQFHRKNLYFPQLSRLSNSFQIL